MTLAIETRDLTKRFGAVTALENLSLTVPTGTVYGFLGPNGAGKSTTIDVLLDLVRPTEGSARVFGHDTQTSSIAVRDRTGVLLDGFTPYPTLTGREHIEMVATANGAADDPDAALARVDLDDAGDRAAGGYSKGMTKRLGLAMALVDDPDLLILDEPSTGLDPHGIAMMREIIREETSRGATVFFSSHLLDQVEAVADQVAIVNEGRLLVEDDVDSLKAGVHDDTTVRITIDDSGETTLRELRAEVGSLDVIENVRVDGRVLFARCQSRAATATVVSLVEESDATIDTYEIEHRSLEDIFKAYTETNA